MRLQLNDVAYGLRLSERGGEIEDRGGVLAEEIERLQRPSAQIELCVRLFRPQRPVSEGEAPNVGTTLTTALPSTGSAATGARAVGSAAACSS